MTRFALTLAYHTYCHIAHIIYIIHIHISTFFLVHLRILLSTRWTKSCCKFKHPAATLLASFQWIDFWTPRQTRNPFLRRSGRWSVLWIGDIEFMLAASWLGTDPSPNQLIIFPSDYPFISHCSFAYHWELPGHLTFFHHKMRFFKKRVLNPSMAFPDPRYLHQPLPYEEGVRIGIMLKKTLKARCTPENQHGIHKIGGLGRCVSFSKVPYHIFPGVPSLDAFQVSEAICCNICINEAWLKINKGKYSRNEINALKCHEISSNQLCICWRWLSNLTINYCQWT